MAHKFTAHQNEILKTTNSLGWRYIEQMAEDAVRAIETEALSSDDETKTTGLIRDARGARKFQKAFLELVRGNREADLTAEPIEVLLEYGE